VLAISSWLRERPRRQVGVTDPHVVNRLHRLRRQVVIDFLRRHRAGVVSVVAKQYTRCRVQLLMVWHLESRLLPQTVAVFQTHVRPLFSLMHLETNRRTKGRVLN